MIQNLQPLTLTPLFYWLPGSSTVSRIRSEAPDLRPGLCHRVNLSGGSGPASFHVGPEPNRPSLHLSASISQLLAAWWSLNLSGHYSPPSASTSHPSSLCALFNPAVSLAPSPHNSALSQQITAFPLHLCSNCALSLFVHFVGHFLLMTSFFFLFTLSLSCSFSLSGHNASSESPSITIKKWISTQKKAPRATYLQIHQLVWKQTPIASLVSRLLLKVCELQKLDVTWYNCFLVLSMATKWILNTYPAFTCALSHTQTVQLNTTLKTTSLSVCNPTLSIPPPQTR